MASTVHDRSSAILRLTITLLGCIAALWGGLAIIGVFPPINAGNPDLSAPGLGFVVFLHVLYGTLLFGGIVGGGLAVLSFAPKAWRLSTSDHLLLAPIFGLLSWIAACIIVRLCNGGSFIILGLEFGFIAIRLRQVFDIVTTAARIPNEIPALVALREKQSRLGWAKLAVIYCLGLGFSAHFGLLWRLPSEIPNGTIALGDLAFFTGAYHSLKVGIIPFAEFAVEGESFHPFNQTPQLLALGFNALPRFEISLFLTTSMAMFFFLSVAYAVANMLCYRREVVGTPITRSLGLVLVLLLCAAVRYPSWLVETPPYALALPMALSIIYLIDRGRDRLAFLMVSLPLTVLIFTVTKVMVMPVIGCYAMCVLCLRVWHDRSKFALIGLIGGGILAGILSVILVTTFWHNFISFASTSDFGPYSYHHLHFNLSIGLKVKKALRKAAFLLMMDIGPLFLIWATLRLKNIAVFVSVILGCTLYYAYSYLFWPTEPSCFILMFAWVFLNRQKIDGKSLALLAISATLIIGSFWGRDTGEWSVIFIWTIPLSAMLALILFSPELTTVTIGNKRVWFRSAWQYALVAVCLVSAVAHADGTLRLGRREREPVAPELYDLWVKVRELTPSDALIFTDQTGNTPDRLGGWNDFAMMAERQFYISSWSTSYLRGDVDARMKRLASNDAILQGSDSPENLTLHREYGSYFAAISATRQVPATFQKIYSNDAFSIYRIP
ncbi:MAG TPA: hypothetical protein VM659_13040 [Dongiaceae bacterium]|nr:hypothetical protein [Dongiaceae bacterium]